jgi:AcrR family transcriptional regulator
MPSQRNNDAILDAARDCVLDVGLRRTTLADVARRAGVSRMTVYRQHADLDSLVAALLTRELTALLDQVMAELTAVPTARERLVEAAVQVVQRLEHHPLYRRILDLDPELLLPLVVDRFGSSQKAAMALVETLVHMYDVASTLGFAWDPDPDVVRRTLGRLFPTAPTDHEPWPTLLWATGRDDLDGRPRLTRWRWDASVRP